MTHHHGFTLIELSMVLVIVGLLVGGVLVGRDLIAAAKVRAQITQIEKFRVAVTTFRLKYNAIPGDLPAASATAFGMAGRSGAKGHGDGDGIIEYCDGSTTATPYSFGCENALFWNDLSLAGLIEGYYTANIDSTPGGLTFAAGQQNLYLPAAKIGNGNSISILSMDPPAGPSNCGGEIFCYAIAKIPQAVSGQWSGVQAGLTPEQMFGIDSKMDDGNPNAGKVQGGNIILWKPGEYKLNAPYYASPSTCVVAGGGGVVYNMASTTYVTSPICIINISN